MRRPHPPSTRLEETRMSVHRIFATPFAKMPPMYVQKAERTLRTKDGVDRIVCWLTGYDAAGLQRQIDVSVDFEAFFAQAPTMQPNRMMIKGVVCGVRVEEVEDPLMREIRYLDKLIDALAKGKSLDRILRA